MTGIPRTLRIALGIVIVAGLIVVPMNFNRYGLFILSQWAVMTIAAMGLNLTLGYAGQVSLAQGAFVSIGAYAAAIMTSQGPAADRSIRCRHRAVLCDRLAARLSGATRAASLSGLRDAGLLDAGLSGVSQRRLADQRHLRHQQYSTAEHSGISHQSAAAVLLSLPRFARASSRWRCGGLFGHPGAAPSWRCEKIRSGRSLLASIHGVIR